jgi:hypothetical protein
MRQLPRFIAHAGMSKSFDCARVAFSIDSILLELHISSVNHYLNKWLGLRNQCYEVACSQLSFLLSNVETLDVFCDHFHGRFFPTLEIDTDNTQWRDFFQSFTAVQTLHICHCLQSFIMSVIVCGSRPVRKSFHTGVTCTQLSLPRGV